MTQTKNIAELVPVANAEINALINEVQKAVIGQTDIIKKLIICLLAGGHVLLEGVPGLGKTLLVKALASAVSGEFGRIQFTPDLMPSDVTGHTLYDMQTGQWKTRKGAIFCHLLLADEINRAPAKTQSALLEAMQEGQVTIEGRTHVLPRPFICVATQNPVEQEGTYPLPEAQLDRFLMNLYMDYPDEADEKRLLGELITGRVGDKLDLSGVSKVMSPERLAQLQLITAHVRVDDRVVQYALDIVRTSRDFHGIDMGAGVRAGMALLRCAKASALLNGRDYAVPDDVRYVAVDVLRHRMTLTADFMIDGYDVGQVIEQLLSAVFAPRS
ncbi:AAA family ATPase [Moraxella equi]|uniref:AAA family ATPase n=1 Tax=Moraxella equi TaxID=60442 RepID=A0A378QTA1_9GAMM|nr:MoxR family ATPase [Moraxella equi]OPH37855.1 AAA family ATPase [Moraxella equi]STZ04117.1 ATP-dependent protease Lon [Moraxella equi]